MKPPPPLAAMAHPQFRARLAWSIAVAGMILAVSLGIGVAGYYWIVGDKTVLDALVDASMLLGGMGPITSTFPSPAAKLFASFYALYSGIVLLGSVGVLLNPFVHLLLHRFHADLDESEESAAG